MRPDIEALIASLTLEEKVALLAGDDTSTPCRSRPASPR